MVVTVPATNHPFGLPVDHLGFNSFGRGKFIETIGYSPMIWGVAGYLYQQARAFTIAVGGMLTVVSVYTIILFILTRGRSLFLASMLNLAIQVSLLVTAYLWAYDQILLILCVGFCEEIFVREGLPFLLVAGFSILFSLLSMMLFYLAFISGNAACSAFLAFGMLIMIWMNSCQYEPASITHSL